MESISQCCFYFSSTQRPRGGGGGKIITSCCQNFPQLCQLLYIFIVNWMPPPSSSIDEICVFCHRTIWQKKQKPISNVLYPNFYGKQRVAELSADLPRNNARILRGCKTEKYRLVAENKIAPRKLSSHRQPQRDNIQTEEVGRKQDCPSRKTKTNWNHQTNVEQQKKEIWSRVWVSLQG